MACPIPPWPYTQMRSAPATLMTKVLNVPGDHAPFRCLGIPKFNKRKQRINPPCGAPATGIYTWETKVFGNVLTHKAALCATCGLSVAEQVRAYEDEETHEMMFYKPNHNVRIIVRFNYEHATRPDPHRVATVPTPVRRLGNPRVVRHTVDGTTEINNRMPRVFCEKCDGPVRGLVSERRSRNKAGKLIIHRITVCTVCGTKTHNPDMD